MKKIVTLIACLIALLGSAQAPTSCSLDPTFMSVNKSGIWPDSATNFISGTVNSPYGQNITVKVPKDTTQGGVKFCFNRVELSTPSGYTNFNLPPGLNLLPGSTVPTASGIFKFPGNAGSCAVISGTPTTAGTYTLQFKVLPFLSFTAGSCPTNPNVNSGSSNVTGPTTISYYVITINNVAGMKEEVSTKSFNLNNIPNPFSGKTTVKFSVKDEAQAKLTVYNILGTKVYEDKFKTTNGENTYDLNASDWSNGIYLLTISYKNHTETKRIVINSTR